jgi:hypothetical protein
MKVRASLGPPRNFSASLALACLLASCATWPNVDWDSRVGTFTYDQAIVELGPPDKHSKFMDGKTVASWVTRHSGGAFSTGAGGYASHSAAAASQSVGDGNAERVLRLTFDGEGKLAAWSKNY